MRLIKTFVLLALVALFVLPLSAQQEEASTPAALCEAASPIAPANNQFEQAEQVIEAGVDYRAVFCTSVGAIYIDLLEEHAPVTVNNFVFLTQNDYYNGTIFHRVIEDFMAQGGDPTGTGMGGPGYQFEDEFTGFLTFNTPGWLAMANAGAGTNGSQFFITTAPTEHLNFNHTIFGEVLEGQDIVETIQIRDPQQGGDATTLQTVLIITDLTTVQTSYVAPEKADSDSLITALTPLKESLVEVTEISFIGGDTLISTDDLVATAPADVQEAFRTYLTSNNHVHTLTATINNEACDVSQLPFMSMTYTLHEFDSRESATQAFNDEFSTSFLNGFGFTKVEGRDLFTKPATACEQDAQHGVLRFQRGRFIASVEAIVPISEMFDAEIIITQFTAPIFEGELKDILRAELR